MGSRVIRDTEMTIDESTGVITVKFAGWREDPSKMFSFFPGAGSGQGFPLAGNVLDISIDKIMSVNTAANASINIADEQFNLGLTNTLPNGNAEITLSPVGEGTGQGSVAFYTNSTIIARWMDDAGTQRYGVFDKAIFPNVQPDSIDDPGTLPEALTAISEILAAMRQLGHIKEGV